MWASVGLLLFTRCTEYALAGESLQLDSFMNISTAKFLSTESTRHLPEQVLIQNLRARLRFLGQGFGPRFGTGSADPPIGTVILGQSRGRFNQSDVSTPGKTNGVKGFRSMTPIELAAPAGCEPELVTVPIELTNRSEVAFYYPTCTRAYRCGGCCNHHLLSCVPQHKRMLTQSVIVIDLTTGVDSKHPVEVEEHISCQCACTVQQQHCTPLQRYVEEECACVCLDRGSCSSLQRWDPTSCSCMCRRAQECSTGLTFSDQTCRCEVVEKPAPPAQTSRPPINKNRNTPSTPTSGHSSRGRISVGLRPLDPEVQPRRGGHSIPEEYPEWT